MEMIGLLALFVALLAVFEILKISRDISFISKVIKEQLTPKDFE